MPAEANSYRFDFITISKVLILFVVFPHFYGHIHEDQFTPELYIQLKKYTMFSMPLFMCLSGFLYFSLPQKMGYFSFVKKKFLALMIPYFSIYFTFYLLKISVGYFHKFKCPPTWNDLYYIFFEPGSGIEPFLWFLYALFILFAIAAIFKPYRYGFETLGVLFFALYFMPRSHFMSLDGLSSYAIFFWFGWAISKCHSKLKGSLILGFSLGLAYYFTVSYMGQISPGRIHYMLACTLAILSTIILAKKIETSSNFIRGACEYVGRHSFDIYVWHNSLIMPPLTLLFSKLFGINSATNFWVCLALALFACTILAPFFSNILALNSVTSLLFLGKYTRSKYAENSPPIERTRNLPAVLNRSS